MINNMADQVSLTALQLDKTCFSSEQERLEAFARALVVPIQAGRDGTPGEAGKAGIDGSVYQSKTVKVIAETGVTFVDIDANLENAQLSLSWTSSSSPSPVIHITYTQKLSEDKYRVYFSDATGSVKGWVVSATLVTQG